MEFVEQFGLDPAVAYTPKLNDEMLNITYDQNIASGISEEQALENKMNAARDIKELLAKNGML